MNDLISRSYIMNRIMKERREWGESYDVKQILGDIEDAPAVDAVKVVRCMDCKYFKVPHGWAEDFAACRFRRGGINTDDFCSLGERKKR